MRACQVLHLIMKQRKRWKGFAPNLLKTAAAHREPCYPGKICTTNCSKHESYMNSFLSSKDNKQDQGSSLLNVGTKLQYTLHVAILQQTKLVRWNIQLQVAVMPH